MEFKCLYCRKVVPTKAGLNQHLAKTSKCQKLLREAIANRLRGRNRKSLNDFEARRRDVELPSMDVDQDQQTTFLESFDDSPPFHPTRTSCDTKENRETYVQEDYEVGEGDVIVEAESYPGDAGSPIDAGEVIRNLWKQALYSQTRRWNDNTWRTAHWLMTSDLSGADRDCFLKLPEACVNTERRSRPLIFTRTSLDSHGKTTEHSSRRLMRFHMDQNGRGLSSH